MSIVETVLIFVGIPGAFFALVAALIFGRGAGRAPRYRPGGAWQFKPVWYLPHPEHGAALSSPPGDGIGPAGFRHAVSGAGATPATASGGASGEW